MEIDRVVPDLTVDDLEAAVRVHTEILGMRVVMDHGWIVTLADDSGHQLSLMTADASAPVNPDVSVFVDDVHHAYAAAQATDVEIVHPLTEEPWGVTRFFYRDQSGHVINVGSHAGAGKSTQAKATPVRSADTDQRRDASSALRSGVHGFCSPGGPPALPGHCGP